MLFDNHLFADGNVSSIDRTLTYLESSQNGSGSKSK